MFASAWINLLTDPFVAGWAGAEVTHLILFSSGAVDMNRVLLPLAICYKLPLLKARVLSHPPSALYLLPPHTTLGWFRMTLQTKEPRDALIHPCCHYQSTP